MPSITSSNPSSYKFISLVVLIVQTTALVLILRYSRTMKTDQPRYLSSTAIVVSEIIKIVTCIIVLFFEHKKSFQLTYTTIKEQFLSHPADSLKVAVPAALYTVQNNFLYAALSRLDAATYQVTYQLKILTTAMFAVFMLGKALDRYKWTSLILLTVGVALVQMPSDSESTGKQHDFNEKMQGLLFVLASCVTSGFSGIYFEKILKQSNSSVWVRNLQLAFFSIWSGFFAVFSVDYEAIRRDGFFQGYNSVIWIVVILQAYGGLIIGLVVKYADNILKGFATSLSIILSSVLSYFVIGDFSASWFFFVGAATVIGATVLYSMEFKQDKFTKDSTHL